MPRTRSNNPSQEEKHLEGGKREFTVIATDGTTKIIKESFLRNRIKTACRNLKEVSVDNLLETLILNFYEGIKEQEIDQAAIMAARTKIEVDPAYSKVAARLFATRFTVKRWKPAHPMLLRKLP